MTDDLSILRALKAGDTQALSLLFEQYADSIYRLAFRLVQEPEAAEDIVQETFLKTLTRLQSFEGRAKLSTWLYRVAYNASLDYLRARQTLSFPIDQDTAEESEAAPMPEVFVEWETPESILLDGESLELLDRAIRSLPHSLQIVFVLRDIEGLSTDETAEILTLKAGTVKVRLHRARLALRERLSIYFEESQSTEVGVL
jgi:RNA polymerase sigma-70 factor, ECF subfamily